MKLAPKRAAVAAAAMAAVAAVAAEAAAAVAAAAAGAAVAVAAAAVAAGAAGKLPAARGKPPYTRKRKCVERVRPVCLFALIEPAAPGRACSAQLFQAPVKDGESPRISSEFRTAGSCPRLPAISRCRGGLGRPAENHCDPSGHFRV
jgi:hypothetical protein